MRATRFAFALAVMCVALSVAYSAQQVRDSRAEVALQAAIKIETIDGDLKAAIAAYSKVVATYSSNRSAAAQALVRMGQCYEKLGAAQTQEARKTYEQVLRDYGDQATETAAARSRLAALTEARPTGLTARKVMSVAYGENGLVSPGGNYMAFTDWDSGDLAIREFGAAAKRRLTNKGSWAQSWDYTTYSVPSRDGSVVAYDWNTAQDVAELRIIGRDGSKPQVLYRSKEAAWIHPYDFNPEGTHVLAVFTEQRTSASQIVLVSVKDGSVRTLKSLGPKLSPIERMSFSPDGKHVAFDYRSRADSPQHDIFLLSADGAQEAALVEHPAHEVLLGWTPDGARILFSSDRTGATDAWLLAVANGKSQGSPELVKKDLGRVSPMGFDRSGSYYYAVDFGPFEVYVATVDLTTGKVVTAPSVVPQRFEGSNVAPDWFPDGKSLFYVSRRGPAGPGFNIPTVRSMATHEERDLFPKLTFLNQTRLSPDGQSVVAVCRDQAERRGICRIDLRTGDSAMLIDTTSAPRFFPVQHPDGKHLLFMVPASANGGVAAVRMRNLETGEEREVARGGSMFGLSPDGQQVAYFVTGGAADGMVLKVAPLAGGEPRELFRLQNSNSGPSWTPDGRHVLVAAPDGPTPGVWVIPVDGGKPVRIDLRMKGINAPRLHPDGRQLAFWAVDENAKSEIWALENFLPKPGVASGAKAK